MVRALLNPTNEQLQAYALKRPRFYALVNSPKVEYRGTLEPEKDETGQLRWVTTEGAPVSIEDLRMAHPYTRDSYKTDGVTVYLFIYRDRGKTKYYYVIPQRFVALWQDEGMRQAMLSDDEMDDLLASGADPEEA